MMTQRSRCRVLAAVVGLGLLGGCQTWVPEAALTLPSGRYLEHPPQYIPPSPPYPLPNELRSLEEAAAQQAAGLQRPGPAPAPGFAP
jgi:hypothetical protein